MSRGKVVQNQQPDFEDIQPVIDDEIVEIVSDIFQAVTKLNALRDIFEDLGNRLIADLAANSFMEVNLELKEEQKDQLRSVIKSKGEETVRDYLAKVNIDERTKEVYGICRQKATSIADAILSAIGQEINRGAIINAEAVQANSKNKAYDEILLRKTKSSGDITVPTSGIFLSSNCVEVIKASCQEEKEQDSSEEKSEKAPAEKPTKQGKKKK